MTRRFSLSDQGAGLQSRRPDSAGMPLVAISMILLAAFTVFSPALADDGAGHGDAAVSPAEITFLPLAVAVMPDEGVALEAADAPVLVTVPTSIRREGAVAQRVPVGSHLIGPIALTENDAVYNAMIAVSPLDLAQAPCGAIALRSLRALGDQGETGKLAAAGLGMEGSGDSGCLGPSLSLATNGEHATGVNVAFIPEGTLCPDGTCTGRSISSRVQFDLDQFTDDAGSQGVYLFAGADDKAIMWRPTAGAGSAGDGDVLLDDTVTVGDVEAGITLKRERAEVSLSYIHRETSYRLNEDEKLTDRSDYVGVVLRLK